MSSLDELALVFKALADRNRLAILELLRTECGSACRLDADQVGATVTRIARSFDLALSTVSHHLKELRRAGLIHCVRRGQSVYCSPNPEALRRLREFLLELPDGAESPSEQTRR